MLSFPKRNECLLGHPQTPKEGRKEEENAEPRDQEEDEDKKKKERKAKGRKRGEEKKDIRQRPGPLAGTGVASKGDGVGVRSLEGKAEESFPSVNRASRREGSRVCPPQPQAHLTPHCTPQRPGLTWRNTCARGPRAKAQQHTCHIGTCERHGEEKERRQAAPFQKFRV